MSDTSSARPRQPELRAALAPLGRACRVVALALIATAAAAGSRAAEPILVPAWKVVGPFEAGSREGFVNPLAGPTGRVPVPPDFTLTYPSVLADGGRVAWRDVEAERDEKGALTGRTNLKLEGVAWDARQDEWGAAALMNAAHAAATVTVAQDGTYLLDASRCVVSIDGVSLAGDPYGAGIAQSIVRLRAGSHELLVGSVGFGGQRAFELRLVPIEPGERVRIAARDLLLPDLLAGAAGSGFAGVAIVNTLDEWQGGLRIVIDGGLSGSVDVPGSLPPRGSLKVAVPVAWAATARGAAPDGGEPGVDVRVRVVRANAVAEALAEATGRALVRSADQSRTQTFLSRLDGSAQMYGLLEASEPGPGKALIFSLHGASVECRGQAGSYSRKSWAHVVAPTNRRPFGFDWHDWGALDAEEVLALASERLAADRSRIHLAGHSMGGHGAWIFGVSHAGTFATVAPSAGWSSYDLYMPGTLRRSLTSAPPELAQMWERGLSPGRVAPALENLVATPVFVLHGGADDNVPPAQGRLLAGELERRGGNVTYREVPGQGHWWDIDEQRPGADCVDSAELEAFWRSHALDPWPRRVVLDSADPDLARSAHWVTLLEQERTGEMSRIVAQAEEHDSAAPLSVSTRNVRAMRVSLSPPLRARAEAGGGRLGVRVDGQLVSARVADSAVIELRRVAPGSPRWRVASARSPEGSARAPLAPGGIEKAMYEPFVLVVGTRAADPATNERLLDLARALSLAWWVRANGTCPVVRDVEVSDALRATKNLVLLGGPEANAETARIEKSLLIVARRDRVTLAGRALRGSGFACAHWQPHPEHRERRVLVFQASSPDGEELLPALNPIGGGHGLPDFVVATPQVRRSGWGGFAAAGWWTPDFTFDRRATWLATEPAPGEAADAPVRASVRIPAHGR